LQLERSISTTASAVGTSRRPATGRERLEMTRQAVAALHSARALIGDLESNRAITSQQAALLWEGWSALAYFNRRRLETCSGRTQTT
jgi:hypothetical protein